MRKAICIQLAVVIGLLIMVSRAAAQNEQWLQYHSSREADRVFGDSGSQRLELSSVQPTGLKLPQFKGKSQLFAKWPTPMVKSGRLWIALDRTHEQGPYDLLYIDSNGNGGLDDETAVMSYRTGQRNAYFGPVKVIFEIKDGPVTYHLNFRFYQYGNSDNRLFALPGSWYEGDITVGGQKKHCVLFDYNANGAFDDKSANADECDRIRIGEKGAQDTLFTGNYIQIDQTIYKPDIARDGACISFARAENVRFGDVRLAETVTQLSAHGENGLFILKPEKGIASLPVGKYRVYEWAVERQDDKGINWRLEGRGLNEMDVFDINKDRETELSVGEPIIAVLDASERQGTHSFRQNMKGRAGERIRLTRSGSRPQAPKVHIKSADGTYDRTYSFQYG